MSKEFAKTKTLVQLALLSAILFVMGFTPLGSIPLGGPIVATLAQIPVVIGAILLGRRCGMFLGGVFGLVSLLWFTIYGPPTAFVFSPFYSVGLAGGDGAKALGYALASLIICFVPRVLIGLVAAQSYAMVRKRTGSTAKAAVVAGVCGSLVNTLLVLGGILLFFAAPYAQLGNQVIWAILGTSILVNGIPEAIVTPIVTAAVIVPLDKLSHKAA